ncbi:MAG: hypothetical protein ABUJ92_00445, partial [Desulfobacterales bacterium]
MSTNPLILHTNKIESASSITVTSEAAGFEKEKAYDHRTSTSWKAAATGTVYYTVDMGTSVDVSAWACYAKGDYASIKPQYSNDNFAADINDLDVTVSRGIFSYDSVSFSVTSEDTSPFGVAFNVTGTKMYIVGTANKSVFQYSLSTAFDLSTASY